MLNSSGFSASAVKAAVTLPVFLAKSVMEAFKLIEEEWAGV